MKNPFKRQAEGAPVPREPRIAGRDDPHPNPVAMDAFKDVVMRVPDARRPARPGESATDPLLRLDQAIEAATPYCNQELLARMEALREAVVEESMGGPAAATVAAQQHFTLGCRKALGLTD